MANRNDEKLAGEVRALAEKLKIDAPNTDGMSSQQLNELLTTLRNAEQTRPSTGSGEPSPPPATADQQSTSQKPVLSESEKAKEQQREAAQLAKTGATVPGATNADAEQQSEYKVAAGKAITAIHGEMIQAGSPISAKDLPDGEKRLEELHKAGIVTKAGDEQDPATEEPEPSSAPTPETKT